MALKSDDLLHKKHINIGIIIVILVFVFLGCGLVLFNKEFENFTCIESKIKKHCV
jgi:hypothetical protein